MTVLPPILQILLVLIAVIAGTFDLRFRRIPNWLTLPSVLFGFGLNTFLYGWKGLQMAAFGLGLALLIYFPLYLLRGMGAGDVKLMGAIGALAGPANWFAIFVLTAILGGVVALFLLLFKGRLLKTLSNVGYMLKELLFFRAPYMKKEELDIKSPKALTLPHGVMIALGSLAFLAAGAVWGPK